MLRFIRLSACLFLFCSTFVAAAQNKTVKGKVIDAITKEALEGATLRCSDMDCKCSCLATAGGAFELHCRECRYAIVSYAGYNSQQLDLSRDETTVSLIPTNELMQAVVVTAGKGEKIRRTQAPVAISLISTKTIQETKAASADQLLNKISGVNMVNLGNEQHQMSIRQPMTTKSLFLYLEDGIPVRTTGLFNHNALLEMNVSAVKNIEVIKGPSSSLYGSEAIGGVVNFITYAPPASPILKAGVQANGNGYKKTELQAGFRSGKWGFTLNGYYADKRNGPLDYTDFHKGTLSLRADYRIDSNWKLTNALTVTDYYSDMPGGVDSLMFARHNFVNPQTFTNREVNALRARSTLSRDAVNRHTSMTLFYRDNSIGQNPNYRIKDDYKKTGTIWTGKKDLAHGEINKSSFHSAGVIAQHKQNFEWKKTALLAGASADFSPSTFLADYIRIHKDTVSRKYTSFEKKDSVLTNYQTSLNNFAGFVSLETEPVKGMKWVASLRLDQFRYKFDNQLRPSAYSGSPDTTVQFNRLSPKIGFTLAVRKHAGLYANYSEGFVPPQVSEMFTGVKVPQLSSPVFTNYETGGWLEFAKGKLNADFSLYLLKGRNEIISVKLDDGSFENRNAGKTSHRGLEFGFNYIPSSSLSLRLSGAASEHRFENFVEKGLNYSGKEMNNAPRWMHNAEVWYRPRFVKGLRIGAEWQKIGAYFMDAANTMRYQGYDQFNLRLGYQFRSFDLFLHVLNAADSYFSYISTKTTSTQSYQLADPRSFEAGISYNFSGIFKN